VMKNRREIKRRLATVSPAAQSEARTMSAVTRPLLEAREGAHPQ
jgi:hypothetical protein